MLAELEKNIGDERWYVVRNVVTILGKFNTRSTFPLLRRLHKIRIRGLRKKS